MDFKYKIADVAKEFGMPAKKVVETVSGVTGEAYKTAGTFEEKELNVLLETLTRENAEDSLDAYLASGKEPAPAPKAEKKPEPKKQPAAAQQPAAKPKPAEQPKPAATTDKLYRVQVGAFAVRANAEKMLRRLKDAGFEGYIRE